MLECQRRAPDCHLLMHVIEMQTLWCVCVVCFQGIPVSGTCEQSCWPSTFWKHCYPPALSPFMSNRWCLHLDKQAEMRAFAFVSLTFPIVIFQKYYQCEDEPVISVQKSQRSPIHFQIVDQLFGLLSTFMWEEPLAGRKTLESLPEGCKRVSNSQSSCHHSSWLSWSLSGRVNTDDVMM